MGRVDDLSSIAGLQSVLVNVTPRACAAEGGQAGRGEGERMGGAVGSSLSLDTWRGDARQKQVQTEVIAAEAQMDLADSPGLVLPCSSPS